jgi:DNA-binding PadR family transcriptional regulator
MQEALCSVNQVSARRTWPKSTENGFQLPVISTFEKAILTTLTDRPLCGLEISRKITSPSPLLQILKLGSLYSSLHCLEIKGLVTSWMSKTGNKKRAGNRQKFYQMTRIGAMTLANACSVPRPVQIFVIA